MPLETSEPFMEVAAEIGIVMLLLTLGLEFSPVELVTSLRRHAPSGAVDLVLNATPGLLAGLWLGLPWPAAVALAGVTWISSSGIVARLLGDLGRLANRETPAVLSVLVLEDLAMAVFLPLLAVALAGGGPVRAVAGGALAVGVVLLMLRAALRHGHRLGALLTHPDDEQVLLRVFGLTMLVAGLAQASGASAAVGAFLVGIAMPASFADRARSILSPLRYLFAATFFVAFAMSTDPGDVLPVLPLVLVLAVVTAATKLGTGWYAARADGIGRPGRLRAGGSTRRPRGVLRGDRRAGRGGRVRRGRPRRGRLRPGPRDRRAAARACPRPLPRGGGAVTQVSQVMSAFCRCPWRACHGQRQNPMGSRADRPARGRL